LPARSLVQPLGTAALRLFTFLLLLHSVFSSLGCGSDATPSASPQQRSPSATRTPPAPFLAELESLVAAQDFDGAVQFVRGADLAQLVAQAADHSFSGFLAVAEDLIILPDVRERNYDPSRDWALPGTSDVIEHSRWQRAATEFAANYNKLLRRSQRRGA